MSAFQTAIDSLPGDWPDAACKETPFPDAWHPGEESGLDPFLAARYAKSVCKACPVRLDCLQWALEAGITATYGGIYGGASWDERRKMRRGAA